MKSKDIHLCIHLNTLHKKFQRNMIETIRPAVLLCRAGAETTDGVEVISKTENLFKGDGKCNKPSRYLLHWFHTHRNWGNAFLPTLLSEVLMTQPHQIQQCQGKQGWTCVRIMGSGGLGFNFWANVLIWLGGRARSDRPSALGGISHCF